jgi:hypothetical protein
LRTRGKPKNAAFDSVARTKSEVTATNITITAVTTLLCIKGAHVIAAYR